MFYDSTYLVNLLQQINHYNRENQMNIHPYARAVLSTLSLPSPIQKYFGKQTWEIDLSNNTNPYMAEFSEYPDVKHTGLKDLYLQKILSINSPISADRSFASGLSPENLLFTVGSMEGLDLLMRTFAEPNKDTICILHPDFSAYEHWSRLHNLRVKKVPLAGENLETILVEDIVNLKPKLVFLSNPNNPTGAKLDTESIEVLCKSLEGFVIVDEAYIEFSDFSSSIFNLSKYNNLIILRTLSKAWGLAGVRCGAIIAHKLVINALRYVQLPFGFSSLSQDMAKERLLNSEAIALSWQRIKKDRKNMIEQLMHSRNVTKVFPSQTNFIMAVLKNFPKTMATLGKNKILVLDCSLSVSNSIRISLGNEEQNAKVLSAIFSNP
jgi:histidinol-phosphate aminotransferase